MFSQPLTYLVPPMNPLLPTSDSDDGYYLSHFYRRGNAGL